MLIYSVHAYDAGDGGYALDVKIGPGISEDVFYKVAKEVADQVFTTPITLPDEEDEEI